MPILVDYLCAPTVKHPKDHAVFTDLTQARNSLLSHRVGLGEAVTLVTLLEAPCELRVRRADLPHDADRNILAGLLAAADSRLILCRELIGGEAVDAQEWTVQAGRVPMVDELVALTPSNGHRAQASSHEELAEKASKMNGGLGLPFRLVATLLADSERAAVGTNTRTFTEAQVGAMAKEAGSLLTREVAGRIRAFRIDKGIEGGRALDLSGMNDLMWIDLLPVLLLATRNPFGGEVIVVDEAWAELNPIRRQILARLAERTGGSLETGYQERLAPAEAQIVDAAVDFVADVYGQNFLLMIDHPGRGVGLTQAIERYLRARPNLTLESLATKLNEDGYPVRQSGQWVAANVREVMLQSGIKMPPR